MCSEEAERCYSLTILLLDVPRDIADTREGIRNPRIGNNDEDLLIDIETDW